MIGQHTVRSAARAGVLAAVVFGIVAVIPSTRPPASRGVGFGIDPTAATMFDQSPPKAPRATSAGPYPRLIRRVQTDDPVVFVTVDDGWFRNWQVVKLATYGRTPMTVFLTEIAGRDERGAYFRALQHAGARIENHTLHHPNLLLTSDWGLRNEICGASSRLESRFGARPSVFRPPYGLYDARVVRAAWKCGIKWIVLWNVEVQDGRILISKGTKIRRGDIVLLHFRPELRHDLEVLRQELKRRNLRIAPLEEYLTSRKRPPTRRPLRG